MQKCIEITFWLFVNTSFYLTAVFTVVWNVDGGGFI